MKDEAIIAISTSSAPKFPKCKCDKGSTKTGSLCDKRGYLLILSVKSNVWTLLVILSLKVTSTTKLYFVVN